MSNNISQERLTFQQHLSQPAWFNLWKTRNYTTWDMATFMQLTLGSLFSPLVFQVKVALHVLPGIHLRVPKEWQSRSPFGDQVQNPFVSQMMELRLSDSPKISKGTVAAVPLLCLTAQNMGFYPRLTTKPVILVNCSFLCSSFRLKC